MINKPHWSLLDAEPLTFPCCLTSIVRDFVHFSYGPSINKLHFYKTSALSFPVITLSYAFLLGFSPLLRAASSPTTTTTTTITATITTEPITTAHTHRIYRKTLLLTLLISYFHRRP
ncbi:hypothetical protein E2C01_028467 [Portunus trituberculatus]|uniref:Uncharacterized protein n=1 Tax=Portunus trituberculatus TaxID=210409 RepID=A0A5B7EP80_PORTR|nr:hypothetical protein [Portunus trituberculatus]